MRRRREVETIKEPVEKTLSDFEVGLQFNWYRLNFNEKQAKEFLLEYAQTEKQRKLIRKISYVKLSKCWLARMLSNKNVVPDKYEESLNDYLSNLDKEVQAEKIHAQKIQLPIKTVDKRDRVLDEAYGYMEDAIDVLFESKGKDSSLTAERLISIFNLNKKQCKSLSEDVESQHIHYLQMVENDEDAQEAYSFLTRPQRKNILKGLVKLKNELEGASQHKERKPRKIKEKSVDEKAGQLKFKETAFNCKSIDIKSLIGKKTMFVASDDKRTLFKFTSNKGFDVRSSFITNIDKAERIISYGKGLEECVCFVCSNSNPAVLNKMEKHVKVSRKEEVELKNNEYRSTDKFCVIKTY